MRRQRRRRGRLANSCIARTRENEGQSGAMRRGSVLTLLVLVLECGLGAQDRSGRIEGRVLRGSGDALGGVSVVLNETSATAITGNDGRFVFGGLPAGRYSLTITLGENLTTIADVDVVAGAITPVERTVDWDVGFSETLVVSAPSRRVERIIDAPGSVTTVPAAEIEQRAAHAQLPKLLEFSPGVQVTQSGLYDYNLNTRGFNSSLNRRVATLIDGRDPSIPFLGAQEWAAIPFPLDDLAGIELLRGPSAALYGANASSGVLNMTTKDPRNSPGGAVRATVGQLDTINLDFRWAHSLGNGWYTKLVGGVRRHDDFTVSRVGAAEYTRPCAPNQPGDCLPQEAVPLARDRNEIFAGAARLDKHLANGMLLILEGGLADLSGPVFQTGIGRVQFVDVQRPWARADFTADRFNLLASYTGRRSPAATRTRLGRQSGRFVAPLSVRGPDQLQDCRGPHPRRGRRVGGRRAHRHAGRSHWSPDGAVRTGRRRQASRLRPGRLEHHAAAQAGAGRTRRF